MARVEGDAIPFDIPEPSSTEKPEEAESKGTDEKKSKPKKKKGKKSFSSDDSSDSSGDFHYLNNSNSATIISINRGKDIHIGNHYQFSQVNNAHGFAHVNVNDKNCDSRSDESNKNFEDKDLPDYLINSTREINTTDMYEVAEQISTDWKKLARNLSPGNVFSEGQLKTFAANNPNNLQEAIIDMLNSWKDKCPDHAVIGALAKVLRKIKRSDIAFKLKP